MYLRFRLTTKRRTKSSWWFQPIWKIWVNMGASSPIFGMKINKYLSCHLETLLPISKSPASQHPHLDRYAACHPLQLDQQWQSLVRILQNHLREVLPGGKISGAKVDRILMVQKSGKLTSWGSGSLSHYSQGFGIHPWWCRISEPSTVGLQDKKQVVENWAKMWQQAMDLKAGAVSVRTPCHFSC